MTSKPTYEDLELKISELERRIDKNKLLEKAFRAREEKYRALLKTSPKEMTEDELKNSEEKYRSLVESSNDLIFTVDLEGKLLFINAVFEKLLGYSTQEIKKMNGSELLVQEDLNRAKDMFNQVTNGKCVKNVEIRLKKKDGLIIYVLVNAGPIYDARKNMVGLMGSGRDITELKLIKSKTQHIQKMNAIGALAGGIAHQFNNALVGILGNVELIKMEFPHEEKMDDFIKPMRDSVTRMSNLTDQLLAYARGGKYRSKSISLNNFLEDTLPLISHRIDPAIQVETDFPMDIFHVEGDQTQMQMVLSAVISNAAEAIKGEGRIRIIARNKEMDKKSVRKYPGLKPGHYVCISVKDDGKGMDEETLNRVFEPFFTTNFQGRGLGMSAVYGIVKNHNGWIGVDSKLGKGTIVSIFLPAINAIVTKKEDKKANIFLGTGTILLIEDEEMTMDVSREMIKRLGYHVLVAKTGEEAIQIANSYDGDINLAILDIGLPDIDGTKVYPLLMKARSDLKVIICSGFSIDGPVQEILDAGAQGFIQKPFSFAMLSGKIKTFVDRRKHKRFKVIEGAVAVPGTDKSKQGQIMDICIGGLAFNYNKGMDLSPEFSELAINMANEGFVLDNIPCRIISGLTISDGTNIDDGEIKRVSVKFGELTVDQKDRVNHFIQNHTL